jgi:hypothetical protein
MRYFLIELDLLCERHMTPGLVSLQSIHAHLHLHLYHPYCALQDLQACQFLLCLRYYHVLLHLEVSEPNELILYALLQTLPDLFQPFRKSSVSGE